MGINHRCDRIGCIVKAIDEFKAQRNQQGNAQQQKGRPCGDRDARFRDIFGNTIGREKKTAGQNGKENKKCLNVKNIIKFGSFDAVIISMQFFFNGNGCHFLNLQNRVCKNAIMGPCLQGQTNIFVTCSSSQTLCNHYVNSKIKR